MQYAKGSLNSGNVMSNKSLVRDNMIDSLSAETSGNKQFNQTRRTLLKSAAFVGTASVAPSVFGSALSTSSSNIENALSGELTCSISNPVKTLKLRNHSNKKMVIDQLDKSAFMYDGNIVDCNVACSSKPITILPNQEIEIQFDKRDQQVVKHSADEFRRVQNRITRLNDGTRVIPFTASLKGSIATVA